MIYTILWALFALGIIAAVPVALLVQKRNAPTPIPLDDAEAEAHEDGEVESVESFDDGNVAAVDGFGDAAADPAAGFGDDGGFGGNDFAGDAGGGFDDNDFAAFDDELK